MDEKPRMTAEEADARFDALVREHRRDARTRSPRGPRISKLPKIGGAVAFAIVYVIGVAAGAVFHAKPLGAVLLGLPLLLVGRWLLLKLRSGDSEDAG